MNSLVQSTRFRVWFAVCYLVFGADFYLYFKIGEFGIYTIFFFMIFGFPSCLLVYGAMYLLNQAIYAHPELMKYVLVVDKFVTAPIIWILLFSLASIQWFWLVPKLLRAIDVRK